MMVQRFSVRDVATGALIAAYLSLAEATDAATEVTIARESEPGGQGATIHESVISTWRPEGDAE